MKKATLICLLFILTTILHGQEIKISIAPTINDAFFHKTKPIDSDFRTKVGYSATIDYFFHSDNRIHFGVGLSYQYSQVLVVPAYQESYIELLPFTQTAKILSSSFNIRYNLKKDFYICLYPTLSFELNNPNRINTQTGIGLSSGFGKNIKVKNGIMLNIEPRFWIHNIIPFNGDPTNPLSFAIIGLNFGIVFGQMTD